MARSKFRMADITLAASQLLSGVLDIARIPDLSGAKITSGTVAAARLDLSGRAALSHTHAFADLTGVAAAVHTHPDLVQRTMMIVAQPLPAALTGLNFPTALRITAGRNYSYRIKLFCTSSSASALLTSTGSFAVGESAAATTHIRGLLRVGNTLVGKDMVEDASLTTQTAGTAIPATVISMLIIEGFIECSGTGTINPSVTPPTNIVSIRKGSTFELIEHV